MTLVKSTVGVLLFALGCVFALGGAVGFDLEMLLGGVIAVAAGVYVMQRL